MKTKITEAVVNQTKPPATGGQQLIWDTELTGFGLLVSQRSKSFVVKRRNVRRSIGRHPALSVAAARKAAMQKLAAMEERPLQRANRTTLREAMADYIGDMRKAGRAERSITGLEYFIRHYLGNWLNREIRSFSKVEVKDRHTKIGRRHGHYAANGALRAFRSVYNKAFKLDDTNSLPPNPAMAITWFRESRRREPPADLAKYFQDVKAIQNPIRRCYRLALLFTGLRATDCATIKLKDVDWDRCTLHRPSPKGGKSFTVPLSRYAMAIFRKARQEGAKLVPGTEYLFPAYTRRKQPTWLQQPREHDRNGNVMPSPHRSRDAYISAAHAAGVDLVSIKMLVNHRMPSADVTEGYINPEVERLRAAQEAVTRYILKKCI